jgi:hypothetical protein
MRDKSSHRIPSLSFRRSRLWRWAVAITWFLALACLLIIGLWGYDRWANRLPTRQLALPPMPSPNGYERAVSLLAGLSRDYVTAARTPETSYRQVVSLLARLPPEEGYQAVYRHWPEAAPGALRRSLAPAEPRLRALRDTLRLE